MIIVPFVLIKEAHSWVSFECGLRGYRNCIEERPLSEIIENGKGAENMLITVDKIERVRNFIRVESYGTFNGKPSILKKLNALLLDYERDRDLFKSGLMNMVKYYIKWDFR